MVAQLYDVTGRHLNLAMSTVSCRSSSTVLAASARSTRCSSVEALRRPSAHPSRSTLSVLSRSCSEGRTGDILHYVAYWGRPVGR